MQAAIQALPMALVVAGGAYAGGFVEATTAVMIFVFVLWQAAQGGGGNAEAEKIVGSKAPDFALTDPASGNSGSLLKDYVGLCKPMVIDFYQSF